MEFEVEIGTIEDREVIREELSVFNVMLEKIPPPPILSKVIVPHDFDRKINELEGTTAYTSQRGQLAMAKTLHLNSGAVIVLSPYLYSESFDYQTRLTVYLHELFHCITHSEFNYENISSASELYYLTNLTILFDEYYVNRKSYELIKNLIETKSKYYKRLIYGGIKDHIKTFIDDTYYKNMCTAILQFRYHGSVNRLICECKNLIDEPLKALVYTYAIMDVYTKLKRLQPILKKSKFIGHNTYVLIDYFRNKYISDDFDLRDGVMHIKTVLVAYGLRFEDTKQGLYCHVLDI
jgi:hypothetical protein